MKKITLSLLALSALLSVGSAQDFVVVRGQNQIRAGYSVPLRTLDVKSGLTLNAWALTNVSDTSLTHFSLGKFSGVYAGLGVQYPLVRQPNFTAGLAAGWTCNVSRITQRVGQGEWAVGGFLNWKF